MNISLIYSRHSKLVKKSLHYVEKSMLFLDHKSDSCRSGIVLKLWLSVTSFWRFCGQYAFGFKSQGVKKLNFSPKGLRTVKI